MVICQLKNISHYSKYLLFKFSDKKERQTKEDMNKKCAILLTSINTENGSYYECKTATKDIHYSVINGKSHQNANTKGYY